MIETWHDCYRESWKGVIVDDAFAHPAKMSRALLRRILDEFFARGYVERGDVVVDPFGGIGSTGIEAAYRGLRAVCCELEPKFVDLARANFALHEYRIRQLGFDPPIVVNGDSRRLSEHVSVVAGALVSSPPYAVINSGVGGLNTLPPKKDGQQTGRSATAASQDTDNRYGDSVGQLAKMPHGDVAAILSSPPYATGGTASAQSITERSDKSAEWVKRHTGSACREGYGRSDGQLAEMETETFWSGALAVVGECFALLRPGGATAWVVKAYVKEKQIVDFPDQWRRLCERVGFELVSDVRAMLVDEAETVDLFGETVVTRREKKSFFRRIQEAKGSPRIDWETVLIMRKPEA